MQKSLRGGGQAKMTATEGKGTACNFYAFLSEKLSCGGFYPAPYL